MPRLISSCAGLALVFGLSGCAQQKDWVCHLSPVPGSVEVTDADGKVIYTADTVQRSRDGYTGVVTYEGNNLRARDEMAWNNGGTVTLMGSQIRLISASDKPTKIQECVITRPGGQAFRAIRTETLQPPY